MTAVVSVIKQFIGIESITTYIVIDEHDCSGECHHAIHWY